MEGRGEGGEVRVDFFRQPGCRFRLQIDGRVGLPTSFVIRITSLYEPSQSHPRFDTTSHIGTQIFGGMSPRARAMHRWGLSDGHAVQQPSRLPLLWIMYITNARTGFQTKAASPNHRLFYTKRGRKGSSAPFRRERSTGGWIREGTHVVGVRRRRLASRWHSL